VLLPGCSPGRCRTVSVVPCHLHPGQIRVEWQLRELGGRFHRLPPKDDSYRSPAWEPCLPVDSPPFLTGLLSHQIQDHPHPACGCAAQHGGSGRYLFLGPDGGHYRRSNYARRVFRPARDGRYEAKDGRPPKLVIADATTWPGVLIAAWPPADPSVGYAPPRGRGIQAIRDDIPLACWLPIKPGLTVHGLRHGHKTWMAEDGIPEILAEQRLGHEIPGSAGSTPTPPAGCATTLSTHSRPDGKTPYALAGPSTRTRLSRCSATYWQRR
jgi:hypothetical protein